MDDLRSRYLTNVLGAAAALAALALAMLPPAAWASGPAAGSSGSWPQIQGGPGHEGVIRGGALAPPLHRTWRFVAPGNERGLSGPLVQGTTVVAAGRHAIFGVGLSSGRERWRIPRADGLLQSQPAIATARGKEVLLFTEGRKASDSKVRAFDLASRAHLWDVDLGDVSASGVAVDGTHAFVGDDSGTLYGIDVATGSVQWKFRSEGIAESPPAVGGGKLYALTRDRSTNQASLLAVNESTGKQAWAFSPSQPVPFGSAVTLSGDRVFLGLGDSTLRALAARNGEQVWSAQTPSPLSPFTSPAVSPTAVIAAGTRPLSSETGLYRMDPGTGGRKWWFEFDAFDRLSSPLIAGPYAFVGLEDGRLSAVDLATGEEVWEQSTGKGDIGPLAFANGTLVAAKAGPRGGLVAFRHDPSGHLMRVVSKAKLDLGMTVRNYAVAFAAIAAVVLALGRAGARVGARRSDRAGDAG